MLRVGEALAQGAEAGEELLVVVEELFARLAPRRAARSRAALGPSSSRIAGRPPVYQSGHACPAAGRRARDRFGLFAFGRATRVRGRASVSVSSPRSSGIAAGVSLSTE